MSAHAITLTRHSPSGDANARTHAPAKDMVQLAPALPPELCMHRPSDPAELAIFNALFAAVAEEMGLTLGRTAHWPLSLIHI